MHMKFLSVWVPLPLALGSTRNFAIFALSLILNCSADAAPPHLPLRFKATIHIQERGCFQGEREGAPGAPSVQQHLLLFKCSSSVQLSLLQH